MLALARKEKSASDIGASVGAKTVGTQLDPSVNPIWQPLAMGLQAAPPTAAPERPARGPFRMIQRKCACGGPGRSDEEECPECVKTSLSGGALQAQMEEGAPSPPVPYPRPESSGTEQTVGALVVEDDAPELGPGQMRKSEFVSQLRSAVCSAAEAELAATGRTTTGCPYLESLFGHYGGQSAGHIEQVIHRFAPETTGLMRAAEMMPLMAARARIAVKLWARTGEIAGLPFGLASLLRRPPSASLVEQAENMLPTARGFAVRTQPQSPATIRDHLGGGSSLSPAIRTRMETAFGQSFSSVHVHNDATAVQLASSLRARAFTVGNHIAFASGEYRPGTLTGDALIAHELAHVMQQSGATDSSVQPMGGEYNALEEDADRSATHVMVRLWKGSLSSLSKLPQRVLPEMRSGLRLQGCKCEKSENVVPATPLSLNVPAFDCNPAPETLQNVLKASGNRTTLGFTRVHFGGLKVHSERQMDSRCGYKITKTPDLTFPHFVFTDAGTYDDGEEDVTTGRCKGKKIPRKTTITPDMAKVIKAGEVEHCEDEKLAFALSHGKYIQALQELEAAGRCARDSDCSTEMDDYLKTRVGVDFKGMGTVADCLALKSQTERDDKGLHTVDMGKGRYAKDCSSVTYTPDPTKVTGVGTVKPVDIVKGCGEPP